MLAFSGVDSGEATESEVLGLLVLVGKTLDSLGSKVDVLGHVVGGDEDTSLGLGGSGLLGTPGLLVLGDEGEGSLEFLFGVLVGAGNADGGVGAAGVVETGHGEGVVGPLVVVVLDKVGVVSLGKSPDNAVGSSHF